MKYGSKGINYISCQNKISTDNITKVQHTANDILFKIQNTHITSGLTQRAYDILKDCWLTLNKTQVTNQKAIPKKQELLRKLQEQILILRGLLNEESSKEDLQVTLNYNLSRAITFNKEAHTPQELLEKILELRQLKDDLGLIYSQLHNYRFEQMITQLKEQLMEKLD